MARCPVHDDLKASLSIAEGDDGTILLKCYAGCETGAALVAIEAAENAAQVLTSAVDAARGGAIQAVRRILEDGRERLYQAAAAAFEQGMQKLNEFVRTHLATLKAEQYVLRYLKPRVSVAGRSLDDPVEQLADNARQELGITSVSEIASSSVARTW